MRARKAAPPPSLRQLQRGLGALIGGRDARHFSMEWFKSDPLAAAEVRLEIYASAYFERLCEALRADFPATAMALDLGAKKGGGFARCIAGYLMAHPPRGTSISEAGRELADYLGRQERIKPWVKELAHLEWSVLESFYAAEGAIVTPKELAGIGAQQWSRIRLELAPSVRLHVLSYPVDELWKHRRDPQAFGKLAQAVRAVRGSRAVCLWRVPGAGAVSEGVSLLKLEGPAYGLLVALSRGARLSSACRTIEKRRSVNPARIQSWFSDWISRGVISRVYLTSINKS